MISAYSLRITLGRRHCKQRTDRVPEDKGEQLEVNINSSIANGTEISANPVVREATLWQSEKIELDSAFNISDNQFNDGSMIHYIIEKGSFMAETPNTLEHGFNKKARNSRNFKTRRWPSKKKTGLESRATCTDPGTNDTPIPKGITHFNIM